MPKVSEECKGRNCQVLLVRVTMPEAMVAGAQR